MAIELGSESPVLTISERTWRVEIFCEAGTDPTIVAHREKIWTRANGTIAQRERLIPQVRRSLSAVASKTVSGVTGTQLAGLISAWADDLRAEDVAAPASSLRPI